MENKTKVHFMGICGSGTAPTAIIAKKLGFEVSGCDLNVSSYYSNTLTENEIKVSNGHDLKHIEGIDILAISPAILDISPNHPEIIEAKKNGILMTWQEFSAKYLQNGKFVISIAGTHGKSTTTILLGLILENAGLDPIVEAGTTCNQWHGGYRLGKSNYFVCEADEFNNNFIHYNPSISIINNVEMDHPEFFKNIEEVKDSFKMFIKKLKGPRKLVVNEESIVLMEILHELKDWIKDEQVKVIGYYAKNRFEFPFDMEYKVVLGLITPKSSTFKIVYDDKEIELELGLIGKHNVENSLGAFIAALELNVDINIIKESFKNFKGLGRRLDLIADIGGIKIYDDFAHHPTAIASTLESIRISYPEKRIFAIFEPHQISRTKLFYSDYVLALKKADRVIISKPFLGRESNKNIELVDLKALAYEINISSSEYIENYDEISSIVANEVKNGDIIIVFGAGESYKISTNIINLLEEKVNNGSIL